jgi:electron transport complex protein RnfC
MALVELKTFGTGGIHPDPHKQATRDRPIERLPAPPEVRLPLSQHLGPPAIPLVKKGDLVRRGQKIAEAAEGGVPLHATVSGKVKPIDKHPHPTLVTAPAIVIARAEGEGLEPLEFPEDPAWRTLEREESIARIREAGIVGLGGAAFPTWRKLTLPPGVRVDTLILNGAECEPYLTSDYRLMLAEPVAIVQGARIMARLLGVERVRIGIESDKLDAGRALEHVARGIEPELDVRVEPLEVRYPQGAERQLVAAITGRTVPPRGLPSAVGVVVQNVATAAAVCDAVRWRRPLLDRVVTVSGPGVVEPRNVLAPIGTLLSELVAFCGGAREDATRIVIGGPMMGRAVPRFDLPLIKGMNGLLLLTGRGAFEAGFGPCIHCGRCLEVCPLGLEPGQVSLRVEAGRPLETAPYGAEECYECGSCTFVCPADRPLVQFMQVAKAALRQAPARTAA